MNCKQENEEMKFCCKGCWEFWHSQCDGYSCDLEKGKEC